MSIGFLTDGHRALAQKARGDFHKLEPHGPMDHPTLTCKVAGLGYYPYLVPRQYGGIFDHVDVRALCVIREELAAVNAAADSVFAVHGLGSHPVLLAGSEEQKNELLPRVAKGDALFAFALTEPEAGSDVAALATSAASRRRRLGARTGRSGSSPTRAWRRTTRSSPAPARAAGASAPSWCRRRRRASSAPRWR